MTRDKERKRIIRDRMGKTGELYTAARAHVLSKAKPQSESGAEALAEPAGIAEASIKSRTGRGWKQWMIVLDADGAASWPHRDIAVLVRDKYGVGDWWGQAVAVGYERIKGLRERGQRRDGSYEVNKSKTFAVPVRTLFRAWADTRTRKRWLGDVNASVRTKSPLKAIRLRWPDGHHRHRRLHRQGRDEEHGGIGAYKAAEQGRVGREQARVGSAPRCAR
jgi:hypothetical protein